MRASRLDAAAQWLETIESAETRRAYRRDIADFAAFAGITDDAGWGRITPDDVAAWRQHLVDRRLAPTTVRRKLDALSACFGYLAERAVATANPVAGIRRPMDGKRERLAPSLNADQAERLLAAPSPQTLKGLRDRAILATLLYQGLSSRELCRLHVSDLLEIEGRASVRVRGARADRLLAIHPNAAAAVAAYLERSGHGPERDGPLFRAIDERNRRREGPLTPPALYTNVIRKYGILSGVWQEVEGLSTRSLRTTAAIAVLDDGASVAALRDWLGHADNGAARAYKRRSRNAEY